MARHLTLFSLTLCKSMDSIIIQINMHVREVETEMERSLLDNSILNFSYMILDHCPQHSGLPLNLYYFTLNFFFFFFFAHTRYQNKHFCCQNLVLLLTEHFPHRVFSYLRFTFFCFKLEEDWRTSSLKIGASD